MVPGCKAGVGRTVSWESCPLYESHGGLWETRLRIYADGFTGVGLEPGSRARRACAVTLGSGPAQAEEGGEPLGGPGMCLSQQAVGTPVSMGS